MMLPITRWNVGIPIAAFIAGIFLGHHLTSNYYEAKENKQKDAVISQFVKQSVKDRETIVNLQKNEDVLRESYATLAKKAKQVKIVSGDCHLTESGRLLWNEALRGLPEDSTGVAEGGGADFARAFENKLLNDEICKRNTERLKAIREWDKETFNEE